MPSSRFVRPQLAVAAAACLVLAACPAFAPDFAEFGGDSVRPVRDRAAQHDTNLGLRLDSLLPDVMREAGVDCWLLMADGPGVDPAMRHLLVSTTRIDGRAVVLLCAGDRGTRRLALGRGLGAHGALYEVIEPRDDQHLTELLLAQLEAAAPHRIAVDLAPGVPLADGLSASAEAWLRREVGAGFVDRFVSAAPLAEAFFSRQLETEAALFRDSARLTEAILNEVLSDRVVFAAGTSLRDLEWAVRERALNWGVELAFAPRAIVYRAGDELDADNPGDGDPILQPGDLFFLSAGVRYLDYSNRVGRWAYLLRQSETEAPQWTVDALGRLAEAAERIAAGLRAGQSATEVDELGDVATAALESGIAGIDRVGRWLEGPIDPLSAARAGAPWHSTFRLAADTGLTVRIMFEVTAPGYTSPLRLLLVETALLRGDATEFVLGPQRTPLLID